MLGLGLLLSLPAAAAPEISGPVVSADGFVTVEMTVPISPDTVRTSLADGSRVMAHDPGATGHQVEPSGDCEQIIVDGLFMGAKGSYTLRRCPTEQGFSETLVATEFYSSYQAEWLLSPAGQGTLVQYRLKAEIGNLAPIVANYELGLKSTKLMKRLGRDLVSVDAEGTGG